MKTGTVAITGNGPKERRFSNPRLPVFSATGLLPPVHWALDVKR